MMNKLKNKKPLFLVIMIALVFGLGGVVMFLWNATLPDIIGVNTVNYWQALGIFVLCKILFGGFKPSRNYNKNNVKRTKLKEKFMNLNEDQKSVFKEEWKRRSK